MSLTIGVIKTVQKNKKDLDGKAWVQIEWKADHLDVLGNVRMRKFQIYIPKNRKFL